MSRLTFSPTALAYIMHIRTSFLINSCYLQSSRGGGQVGICPKINFSALYFAISSSVSFGNVINDWCVDWSFEFCKFRSSWFCCTCFTCWVLERKGFTGVLFVGACEIELQILSTSAINIFGLLKDRPQYGKANQRYQIIQKALFS